MIFWNEKKFFDKKFGIYSKIIPGVVKIELNQLELSLK